MTAYLQSEDVDKLKRIVQEGILTFEVDTLKEGPRDTVKAVAEELGIKPAVCLIKQSPIAYKAEAGKNREEFEELEAIPELFQT